MRRAARVDSTQGAIVEALRGVGALVWVVGCELDLVTYYRGHIYLLDCKAGRRRKTIAQEAMLGMGWPIAFPTTVEEALTAIGAI